MMKKNKIILFITAFASALSFGQSLKEPESIFNSVLINKNEINSFYTGGNPAYLNYDRSDEVLYVKSSYLNEKGEFKRYIDPETDRLYQLSFTGKKTIDSLQVFKGSFGIQRNERKGWNSVFTRDINNWNPFLIGDSSKGNSHFNGIIMNALYNVRVFNNYLLGVDFNYGVDAGLKEIFPHPTSEHRDIRVKAGIGYLINDNFTVGGLIDVSDCSEKIEYQEDLESSSRENVLIKYRGYDYPLYFLKTSEDRFSYYNNYTALMTFSISSGELFSSAGYFGGGLEQTSISDDYNKPQSEGYFKNNFYKGGIKALFSLNEKVNAGIYYEFRLNQYWGKHPDYLVKLMESKNPDNLIKAGIDYKINQKLKLGFEAGIDAASFDYKDYYSLIFWKSNPVKLILNAGADINFSKDFSASIHCGYNHVNISESSFTSAAETPNSLSYLLRRDDISFYQRNYDAYMVSFTPSYDIESFGLVKVYLNYSYLRADADKWMDQAKRETLDAVLEFRLDVY